MRYSNKKIPWLFVTGIASLLIVAARTDLFQPIMQFVHTSQVTNVQVIACIIFSIFGLWLTFFLLNIICKFYANKFEQVPGNSAGILSSHSTDHGGETK